MRNIAKKRIVTEEILEKKKQEKESNNVTKKANLNILKWAKRNKKNQLLQQVELTIQTIRNL